MVVRTVLSLASLLVGCLYLVSAQGGFYQEGHFDIVENFGNLEDFKDHASSSIAAGKTTFVRFIASEG